MDAAGFKDAAKVYIELHDEIARTTKQMRELKKQKDSIGDNILVWMRNKDLDECEIGENKLVRKKSKRTEAFKKEYVLAELKSLVGGDDARAESSFNNIMAMREVAEKDVLTRATKRA